MVNNAVLPLAALAGTLVFVICTTVGHLYWLWYRADDSKWKAAARHFQRNEHIGEPTLVGFFCGMLFGAVVGFAVFYGEFPFAFTEESAAVLVLAMSILVCGG